jgi:hypothetical protein
VLPIIQPACYKGLEWEETTSESEALKLSPTPPPRPNSLTAQKSVKYVKDMLETILHSTLKFLKTKCCVLHLYNNEPWSFPDLLHLDFF